MIAQAFGKHNSIWRCIGPWQRLPIYWRGRSALPRVGRLPVTWLDGRHSEARVLPFVSADTAKFPSILQVACSGVDWLIPLM